MGVISQMFGVLYHKGTGFLDSPMPRVNKKRAIAESGTLNTILHIHRWNARILGAHTTTFLYMREKSNNTHVDKPKQTIRGNDTRRTKRGIQRSQAIEARPAIQAAGEENYGIHPAGLG
jgi:hypothetical protein